MKFNQTLKSKLSSKQTGLVAPKATRRPDTVNDSGMPAYELQPWLRLITILNTSKVQPEMYKTTNAVITELKQLITVLGTLNPYFVAQCIVYSRCIADGMRSINHLAAALLAPHLSGQPWAQNFYSAWDKKTQKGGCIFRTDDMSEIMGAYKLMGGRSLPASMKRAFARNIENTSLYNFGKYTKQIRDVANMVHPDPRKTPDVTLYVGGPVTRKEKALDYIMRGNNIPAETWERAQSEAGQEVSTALKTGKITQNEADQLLQEAKSDNWALLLKEGKLGIMAALRNIRNMLQDNLTVKARKELCDLLTNFNTIIAGKIMPYHFDLANEILIQEFDSFESRQVSTALLKGYELSLPNLEQALPGNNLIIFDQSGSMWMESGRLNIEGFRTRSRSKSGDKATLIAATLAKATKGDLIRFGKHAEYIKYNPNNDVFSISNGIKKEMGSTNLAAAWTLATASGKKYDRVFILSDNECNVGNTYAAYEHYRMKCGDPSVYSIDMAGNHTTQIVGPKVKYLYGYGAGIFTDILNSEVNPMDAITKITSIVI